MYSTFQQYFIQKRSVGANRLFIPLHFRLRNAANDAFNFSYTSLYRILNVRYVDKFDGF